MLNDFAVGPFVFDLMYSAFEGKPEGGSAPTRLVASITVFPSIPSTFSSASATAPPGTATSTASASDTLPPSLPIRVTSWPAFSHRSARPPPTFPRPTTAILIASSLRLGLSESLRHNAPAPRGKHHQPGRGEMKRTVVLALLAAATMAAALL